MAETNARKRPIGFVEASTVETDDFLLIDGQTSGTRKIKPDKVGKANTSDLNNDAGFQNASEVAAAIAANIDAGLDTEGKAADSKAVGDALATKVDAASGKGLSTNDYTTAEKTKLAGVATGATRVLIDSGLSESGKAADAAAVSAALAGKVDKATGKGLSTNDYTTAEKTKLAGIQDGAAAVDATLTVTGKAADAKKTGDEITHVKQDINELEEGKADASGTSENLTAGNAEQLMTDKGITEKVPYLLRASGGNGADREEDKIVGGTVAWNQLFIAPYSRTLYGLTITKIDDGHCNITGTLTTSALYVSLSTSCMNGHVYYVDKGSNVNEYWVYNDNRGVNTENAKSVIGKATADNIFYMRFADGATFDNETITPQIIDLTQMFGTDIADRAYAMEQSTAGSGIAWLKSMGFFTADYYPYDAGTLKSVEGLVAHSMVGFNQWDEEWEVGGIDSSTGQNDSSANGIRTKNYISVMPNTTYYCYVSGLTSSNFKTRWYDANKNYIGTSPSVYYGNTFVTPPNAYYLRFCPQDTYGTTYNHDICINLSDPAKNGTYEPYEKRSYPLDSTLTLRGIPKLDSDNQLYYDGDEYAADGTVTRRYGIVDLGTLTWTYVASGSTVAPYFYASYSEIKNNGNPAYYAVNAICSKYETVPRNTTNFDDKKICGDGSATVITQIQIKDSAYTDAAALKASLSGVYLVYELATATTEEADPYQNPQIVDPYGTEAYETTGIVPVGHDTFYPENLRKKIEGLPFNFATLIAPTETSYKATRAYSTNNLFIVDNILYKATTSIASGGTITPGTNCTATTLAEIIAALS